MMLRNTNQVRGESSSAFMQNVLSDVTHNQCERSVHRGKSITKENNGKRQNQKQYVERNVSEVVHHQMHGKNWWPYEAAG